MNLTHPLRRDELIAAARKELAYRENLLAPGSNITSRDVEEMKQIAEALEAYPHHAETCVRLIVADLMARKGFSELILSIPDWTATPKFWVELLKREVKAPTFFDRKPQPTPAPKEEIEKLDFSDGETLDI